MSKRAILVTGGAGFVGSHACKELSRHGYLPVTLDDLSVGHADAVRWGPLVRANIRDTEAVAAVLASHNISSVLHFAASAYVDVSMREPLAYYHNNVGGMISVLLACRRAGVENFVFSSSCAVYGVPDQAPITEGAPRRPVNPYGRTKLYCEEMLRDMDAAHGLRYAALRYFNAAGADPEGELRERHDPETHVIPLALMAAAGRRPEFFVNGTDYDTPDGTCLRDFVHVHDLARAHVAALARLESGALSFAVNLGSGTGHSVNEVITAVEKLSGRKLPVRRGPRRPGDPPALVADPAAARSLLGWRADRSALGTIVRDAAPGFGVCPK